MKIISFVVDALPEHYFKAELLLFSLERFAQLPKEHILVQCVNRVGDEFTSFLVRNGYRHCTIEPYLDGKYCNKIPQIDILAEEKCEGVFLLDIDMVVLAPLLVGDSDCVWAKIVDGSNPPPPILENIFGAAGVCLPEIVDIDWVIGGGKTIATNFNGGFYYIPHRHVVELGGLWKKWASWLYSRPQLFASAKQFNHIDQIAMAISLAESRIVHKPLPANFNFPTNSKRELRSFLPQHDITVLHYHSLITPFGLLDESKVANKKAIEAIRKVNSAISSQRSFEFFGAYRKASAPRPVKTGLSARFSEALTQLAAPLNRRLKLILHAGTPKTGTTSLQFFLYAQRNELLEKGILYPDLFHNTYAPKHQWLAQQLLRGDAESLLKHLGAALSAARENTHTILLSTEGLFNHWWDFPAESKALLAELTSCFDVSLWVWFREPLSFAESFYRQNIKNPQIPLVKCYGRDLSFEEMLTDDWFARHLDYLGFFYECEAFFGNNTVEAFAYDGDTISTACKKLDFPAPASANTLRENTGLSPAAIDILRVMNRYPLGIEEKKQALTHVDKLDEILSVHSREDLIDEAGKRKVAELTALVQDALPLSGS